MKDTNGDVVPFVESETLVPKTLGDSSNQGVEHRNIHFSNPDCKYCGGSGYDPYYNHDTTVKLCPECE